MCSGSIEEGDINAAEEDFIGFVDGDGQIGGDFCKSLPILIWS